MPDLLEQRENATIELINVINAKNPSTMAGVNDRLPLTTPDPIEERLEVLKALMPEAFSEGKLDLERLKAVLGQSVETGRERYGLSWAGKAEAIRAVQVPSRATLRPMREQSVNFDESENLILEGDNLEVLKLLQSAYHRSIKLIYIDPPYNTGNDFVYEDDFRDSTRAYLRFSGQLSEEGTATSSKRENGGRTHSRWLNMMFPRLQIAKSLLKDDGVIFISIDDNELQNLLSLMDEIFGEENFLATIAWQKKYSPANDTADFSSVHEYLVAYTKARKYADGGKAVATLKRVARTDEQNKAYRNPDNDDNGVWKAGDYTSNKSAEQRPKLYYPITHPKTGLEVWPDRSTVWRYSQDTHEKNVKEGRVWWGLTQDNSMPAYKRYLSEVGDLVSDTWWEHEDVGHTDEAKKEFKSLFNGDGDAFDTPKPVRLMKRLLELSTSPDDRDLVLDFFAGSGTIGQAVLEQNIADGGSRRFILVQIPETTRTPNFPTLSHVTRARVSRAANRIREKGNGSLGLEGAQDLGFRAFSWDTSNFKQWDPTNPDLSGMLEALIDNLEPGRTREDVLFELLLKAGYPLSSPVSVLEVAGQQVYSIDEGKLLIYLERPVSEATLRGMMTRGAEQVLCLDIAFEGNDSLKTNIVLEMRDKGILFRTA